MACLAQCSKLEIHPRTKSDGSRGNNEVVLRTESLKGWRLPALDLFKALFKVIDASRSSSCGVFSLMLVLWLIARLKTANSNRDILEYVLCRELRA